MNVSQLQVGDVITRVNGMAMDDFNEHVIEVLPASGGSVARAQVEFTGPNPAGIQRWLYDDQHEVEVARVLPDNAFVVISDSLLLMKKTLNEMGVPSPNVDDALKALHRFSSPRTETEVVIRPKTV